MSSLEYKLFYHRHLPHYQPFGATLFVTFRLTGSLPANVIDSLREESKRIDALLSKIVDPKIRANQAIAEHWKHFNRWDEALHCADCGPFWLRNEEIATRVVDSLHYRHERVYSLDAFTVMPNHVHVLFTPLKIVEDGGYHSLSSIMHSLKRHTALNANRILGREGAFWQSESYDHVVRDEDELNRIVHYILNNPVKAGLVSEWEQWPWTYCRYGL